MAPSNTIASLAEKLVVSLAPTGLPASKLRKVKDAFTKEIRPYSYSRTNPFEVAERLDGLEEKLQILNCDDLSDALHTRRSELHDYDDKILPDVLDFLLRVSVNPARNSKFQQLDTILPRIEPPLPLKWSDIEAISPIDRDDEIWQVQEYSDFSSDEDPLIQLDLTSQEKFGLADEREEDAHLAVADIFEKTAEQPDDLQPDSYTKLSAEGGPTTDVTELHLTRETLFLLHGLPTSTFQQVQNQVKLKSDIRLQHASPEMLGATIHFICHIGQTINTIRNWLKQPQRSAPMQSINELIARDLAAFDKSISILEHSYLDKTKSKVVSLLQVSEFVQQEAKTLSQVAQILTRLDVSSITVVEFLDSVYANICLRQASNDIHGTDNLIDLFLTGLEAYLKPVMHWMRFGSLLPDFENFFIKAGDHQDLSKLWQEWFQIEIGSTPNRVPRVISHLVTQILACGKTNLFLKCLHSSTAEIPAISEQVSFCSIIKSKQILSHADLVPFSEIVTMTLEDSFRLELEKVSMLLHQRLDQQCGLWDIISDLNTLYLGIDGAAMDALESTIFRSIDACDEAWNDKHLIKDLLEHVFSSQALQTSRLAVRSSHTSSRDMASRRQSVKILGDLSFEYILPWPIANIVTQSATKSYRRLSLLLTQLRRAKYVLERRGRYYVMSLQAESDIEGRVILQATLQKLILFINVWYGHLTSLVVDINYANMVAELRRSTTIDDMITAHDNYIAKLEHTFFLAKKLRPMQESLLSILDLCIQFSDLVIPAPVYKDLDVETNSFVSAFSNKRKPRRYRRVTGELNSDDDDDDAENSFGEEGYSTFIVPENSSALDEVKKIGSQFDRHLAFLVAGLRGLARVADDTSHWALLMERLDWKKSTSGQH